MPAVSLAALLMFCGGMMHLKAVALDYRLSFVAKYNILNRVFWDSYRTFSIGYLRIAAVMSLLCGLSAMNLWVQF